MAAHERRARFVGREPEFARLAEALDRAGTGSASIVLLAGPSGMGASRFLDEANARLGAGSAPPIILRGVAHGPADPPYAAVRDALTPALAELGDAELSAVLGPGAGDEVRLFPALEGRLRDLGAVPGPAGIVSPERRQPRILEGLLGVLDRLGRRRTVLLELEDLHAADAATLATMSFISRIARDGRLCLVGTYQPERLTRDHPLNRTLATMAGGARPPATIRLPALGRREVAALMEGLEGHRPSASVVVLIAERSEGNPLVVEELVAARRELPSAALTGALPEIAAARLARRTPECRRLLRLIALAERPLSRSRIADAAAAFEVGATRRPPRSTSGPRRGDGVLDADLAAGLAEAIEQALVVQLPDDTIGFRHELLGHAVAADLLPFQRPRHHAALAVAWQDEPVIAAAHWRAAHQPALARAAAIAAAERAEALVAPDDALAALDLALELSVTPSVARTASMAGRAPAAATTPAAAATTPAPTPPTPAPAGTSAADDAGPSTAELLMRAAEAAIEALRPTRAVAFAEAALGAGEDRTDRTERADRTQLGVLNGRLGQYRLAAGDVDGALVALRRAVDLVPREASPARAMILAWFAQHRMLAGAFREAERAAREAIACAELAGAEAEPHGIHATTTLGVVLGWGDQPEEGVALLGSARDRATALGLFDDRARATANLTTVLDLLGRRQEAVEVAYAGIDEARRAGLQAVYGNFLGGNASDSLFALGRWEEARELSRRALDWSPTGVSYINAIVNLVIVEIESSAGEEAGRLLGRILVELESGRDVQFAVPAYLATASLALWSGDLADAVRAGERGWERVRGTEDWALMARMAATALEVDAAVVAEALERRRIADVAAARERSGRILAEAEHAVAASGVPGSLGSRREAEANLATARAYRRRLEGRDDAETWAEVADSWAALDDRYRVARARWRQAESLLALAGAGAPGSEGARSDTRAVRADAREPLLDAVSIALDLGARPLLRELSELARRALITLPATVEEMLASGPPRTMVEVGPGRPVEEPLPSAGLTASLAAQAAPSRNGDTFGLSHREKEVLALIAQGRTNREIGDRLFISQKTVGVHVGNILAKLGVSGRVEAAAVAIRLGLTERREVAGTRR